MPKHVFTENEIIAATTGNNVKLTEDQKTKIRTTADSPYSSLRTLRHNGNITIDLKPTFVPHPFSTIVRDDGEFVYDSSHHRFIAVESGWYDVYSQITLVLDTGGRQTAIHALFQNDKMVAGTTTYSYHRRASKHDDEATTVSIRFLIQLTKNEYFDIRSRNTNRYEFRTVKNSCTMLIKRA